MKRNVRVALCSTGTRRDEDLNQEQLGDLYRNSKLKDIRECYIIDRYGKCTIFANPVNAEPKRKGKHCEDGTIAIMYEGGCDDKGKPCDTRTDAQRECMDNIVRQCANNHHCNEISGTKHRLPEPYFIQDCENDYSDLITFDNGVEEKFIQEQENTDSDQVRLLKARQNEKLLRQNPRKQVVRKR